MSPNILAIKTYLLELQHTICQALEAVDGKAVFVRDSWERAEGGSGHTCALSDGDIIEKAGVNFSHVYGKQLPATATVRYPNLAGASFQAVGLSVIVHPLNPYIPTTHFNVRFFIAESPHGESVWWFGGGFDLTPYYGFEEDCRHWHQVAKAACEPFGETVYPQCKQAADEYFYLKHRQEPRGIGGLFFDDWHCWDFAECFAFMRSVAEHFLPAYLPIIERRKSHSYGKRERDFQCYQRGRYVEFNLIYDRGTLFGLQWGGRVESILISLPPEVSWRYDWRPEEGSEEARLYREFLIRREWV